MWSYFLFPVFYYAVYQFLSQRFSNWSLLGLHLCSITIAYLPTYIQTFSWCFKDGQKLPWLQRHWIWKFLLDRLFKDTSVSLEEPLDPSKLYIFGAFPHGSGSVNHFLTMTDCHGMLTKHFPAERRDLAATVLFIIPFVKDVSLLFP